MALARTATGIEKRTELAVPDRHDWLVLGVALSASIMAIFDLFVVNVAMPHIRDRLRAGDAAVELVVSGYAFAYAAGLITGGRLGDRFGYRRMFAVGMASFTTASLLCALARSPTELVVARIGQGLTAAVMVPQVLSLITVTFPPAHRGRATAWYGVATGVAALAAQIGGGLLVDWDVAGLDWRVIFLVNVPIGVAATALALRLLPATRGGTARLDPVGAIAVTVVMALVLVPLALARSSGWAPWVWICLAGAAVAAPATVRWQRTVADGGGEPIIDTRLFANPGVVGAGNGLLLPALLGASLARVRADRAGAASGALNTAQQFANSLGVTVIGTVFFAVAGAHLADARAAMQAVLAIDVVLVLAIVPLVRLGWPWPQSP